MRTMFFLLMAFIFFGLFLWINLSGALFVLGAFLLLAFVVITAGYSDTLVLFLLGAREVRASDEKQFFQAASQEAYKLSVPMPRLYFYDGTLERAFILENKGRNSIVLNKSLMSSSPSELSAICFELLLQVKKGMAGKRTKAMFLLGFTTWIIHSFFALLGSLLPFKDVRKTTDWVLNYLTNPVLDFLFKLMMGEGYFRKLEQSLNDYPEEKELLDKVGLKLRKPYSYYSLPSRKLLEFSSINKSRNFQNILALEFLPHEWDFLFRGREIKGAE